MSEPSKRRWSSGAGQPANLPAALTQEILAAIASLRYGSVEVTVHDSRVIQIERKEKVRPQLDQPCE